MPPPHRPPPPGPYSGSAGSAGPAGSGYYPQPQAPAGPNPGSFAHGQGGARGAGGPPLALVRGGVPPTLADPPPPSDLVGMIRRWHGGKKVAVYGSPEPLHLDWRAMELYDTAAQVVIHPIDYLPPNQDDDDLAFDVWEKAKASCRAYDDGNPHHYMLRCHFTDDVGAVAPTWEQHDLHLTIPKVHAQWGAQAGGQLRGALGGRGYGAPNAHHVEQEIDWAGLHIAGVQSVLGMLMRRAVEDGTTIKTLCDGQAEFMDMMRTSMREERQAKREEMEFTIKMNLLSGALDQCMPFLKYGGLQLTNLLQRKLGQKQAPKTPREAKSFHTLKTIFLGVQKKFAARGVTDPVQIFETFKAMGMPPEATEDLTDLLYEIAAEEAKAAAEASASGLAGVGALLGAGPKTLAQLMGAPEGAPGDTGPEPKKE